jgi:hypothetical protein
MVCYVMLWCPFNTPASAVGVVVAFMVSAQWEEALSPLSSNPALFEDGFTAVYIFIMIFFYDFLWWAIYSEPNVPRGVVDWPLAFQAAGMSGSPPYIVCSGSDQRYGQGGYY